MSVPESCLEYVVRTKVRQVRPLGCECLNMVLTRGLLWGPSLTYSFEQGGVTVNDVDSRGKKSCFWKNTGLTNIKGTLSLTGIVASNSLQWEGN